MKQFLLLVLPLAACSFAPISISVPDFSIKTVDSLETICYVRITQSIDVRFRNVIYEGTALYTAGEGVGGDDTVTMNIYGRADIPSASNTDATCVGRGSDDIRLSGDIVLSTGVPTQVSAGGGDLASLVTEEDYWLGAAINEDSLISLPGDIDFTEGKVKANF